MKLSDLLAQVGEDNIKVQNIDHDFDEATMKGGAATITFRTDPKHVTERMVDKPSHMGLLVWIPRDKLPAGLTAAVSPSDGDSPTMP